MNEITVFQNPSFGSVRTILKDGDPWFVARDVAAALGYSDASIRQTSNLFQSVPDEWKGLNQIKTPGGWQDALTLSEPGLYFFLARSDKLLALPFQKWLAGDVVPSIRKTGQYGVAAVAYSVDDQLAGAARIFNEAGITGNQRVLAMDKLYRQITGRSAIETAQLQLVSPMQEALLTPTQLGQMMTPVRNARSVNQFLLDLGFQRKTRSGWEPTEAGLAAGATLLDVGKSHSNGTPVTQLKWRSSVLRRLM